MTLYMSSCICRLVCQISLENWLRIWKWLQLIHNFSNFNTTMFYVYLLVRLWIVYKFRYLISHKVIWYQNRIKAVNIFNALSTWICISAFGFRVDILTKSFRLKVFGVHWYIFCVKKRKNFIYTIQIWFW